MPHHKSAKKRVQTNEIRRQRNASNQSQLRNAVRSLRSAQAAGEGTPEEGAQVSALLDRMSQKGIIHRNKAARLKSRLSAGSRKSS